MIILSKDEISKLIYEHFKNTKIPTTHKGINDRIDSYYQLVAEAQSRLTVIDTAIAVENWLRGHGKWNKNTVTFSLKELESWIKSMKNGDCDESTLIL